MMNVLVGGRYWLLLLLLVFGLKELMKGVGISLVEGYWYR